MADKSTSESSRNDYANIAKRTWLVCGIILLVALIACVAFVAREVLLLVLLAILFAVGLCRLAGMIPDSKWLPHSARTGLALAALAGLSVVFVASFGLQLEQQYQKANVQIAKSLKIFGDGLDDHPNLKQMLGFGSQEKDPTSEKKGANDSKVVPAVSSDKADSEAAQTETESGQPDGQSDQNEAKSSQSTGAIQQNGSVGQMMDIAEDHLTSSGIPAIDGFSGKLFSGLSTFFSTTFGFLVNLFFVLFIGTMIAINPATYRNGLMALMPKRNAHTTGKLLDELYDTTWHWMIGRLGTMVLTGAGTGLVLALIGVPMAFLLGVLTALLTFIPNIGAIAALILAVLFAAPLGTGSVFAVVIAYGIVQFVESNILTPMIMQQQVAVPPALLISFQFVMAATFGILGVMVSEPIIAILLVVIRRLYIEKSLNQDLETNCVPTA